MMRLKSWDTLTTEAATKGKPAAHILIDAMITQPALWQVLGADGEADGEAISIGHALVAKPARVFAQETDAMAAGVKLIRRRTRFPADLIRQRIEWRSLVINREHEIGSAFRCEVDGDGTARLPLISMANDVRERFLKAKVNGELRVGRDRILGAEGIDPRPKPCNFSKLAMQVQGVSGFEVVLSEHGSRQ